MPSFWSLLLFLPHGKFSSLWPTVLCIAAELRRDGLSVWLGSHPVQALFLKLAPYTLLFWLHGISFLLGMFVFLGWPMHGNLGYLIFCQLLTVCACQAAGALIFLSVKTRHAALDSLQPMQPLAWPLWEWPSRQLTWHSLLEYGVVYYR